LERYDRKEGTLSNFTTLRLESEPPARDSVFDAGRAVEGSTGNHLRYAFLALLAVNIFVISGALCFVLLYFFGQ
jgi:hypothetical protein